MLKAALGEPPGITLAFDGQKGNGQPLPAGRSSRTVRSFLPPENPHIGLSAQSGQPALATFITSGS